MDSPEVLRLRLLSVTRLRAEHPLRTSVTLSCLHRFMEHTIRSKVESFSLLRLCSGDPNLNIDREFQSAFERLSTSEQLNLYERAVLGLYSRFEHGASEAPFAHTSFAVTMSKGTTPGQDFQISFQDKCLRSHQQRIDLSNYFLRLSSKNPANSKSICSLDVCCQVPVYDPPSLRFSINGASEEERSRKYGLLKRLMDWLFEERIWKIAGLPLGPQPSDGKTKAFYVLTEEDFNKTSTRNEQERLQSFASDSDLERPSHYRLAGDQGNDTRRRVLSPDQKTSMKVLEGVAAAGPAGVPRRAGSPKLAASSSPRNSMPGSEGKHLERGSLRGSPKRENAFEKSPDSAFRKRGEGRLQEADVSSPARLKIVKDLMKKPQEQEIGDTLFELAGQRRKVELSAPLTEVLLPGFRLSSLDVWEGWRPVCGSSSSSEAVALWRNSLQAYRLAVDVACAKAQVERVLGEASAFKGWNSEVLESAVRMEICSENSAIVYQKHRRFNEWFRERDFLYLRHAFGQGEHFFFIDRSIENPCFLPFTAIERASVDYAVTRISALGPSATRVLVEIKLDHRGLLSASKQCELTERYLQGFSGLRRAVLGQPPSHETFEYDWQPKPAPEGEMQFGNAEEFDHTSRSFFSIASEVVEPSPVVESTSDLAELAKPVQEELPFERSLKIAEDRAEDIVLDRDGYVVLPQRHLLIRHQQESGKPSGRLASWEYKHPMLRRNWVIRPEGGIKLVNEAMIASQNNVISFVMTTMKNNFFSGKSILNISLPVEIFKGKSNLQSMCEAMAMAPQLLEPAVHADPVERMRRVSAFCFSNSVLYFDIEKGFNPILGETCQHLLDNCPLYAEQVSHHPPVAALLFYGRGYRVFGSIEARFQVHINTADGVNYGYYHVLFDDGDEYLFQTAPGEVDGLILGDRTYAIKSNFHVINQRHSLFALAWMEEQRGFFSSRKWPTIDLIEGSIWRVQPAFLAKALKKEDKSQAEPPSSKYVVEVVGSIGGCWTREIKVDGQSLYHVETDRPHRVEIAPGPLPSDSIFREDLIYRAKEDLARSQIEKERLEILQRKDRKLREKHGKKH